MTAHARENMTRVHVGGPFSSSLGSTLRKASGLNTDLTGKDRAPDPFGSSTVTFTAGCSRGLVGRVEQKRRNFRRYTDGRVTPLLFDSVRPPGIRNLN